MSIISAGYVTDDYRQDFEIDEHTSDLGSQLLVVDLLQDQRIQDATQSLLDFVRSEVLELFSVAQNPVDIDLERCLLLKTKGRVHLH